jgi:hypothetical protein
MPRLSLYRPNKGNDYKFFDRRMSEMFTVGGTDVNIHKYLGPDTEGGGSATEPEYINQSAKNIQDLLFLENRDRKYDPDVYTMRTIYRINDNDFDLTQFGLFLTGDTMFMVFHLNDMIETFGRKIMVGDVMELPHLKDYYPLDEDLPSALKRYYVVQDATKAAEGFAPTWYPHLWRVKVAPLVDSQEYKDILDTITIDTDGDGTNDSSLSDLLSTYDKLIEINDAVIARAEEDVPASGYDTSFIYTAPVNNQGYPGDPLNSTPTSKVTGYLTSDAVPPNAVPPNGTNVAAGISFPNSASEGDFYLRLDYLPNRLFRFNGSRWVKIEDNVRADISPGSKQTQRGSFVNNTDANYKDALAWDAIRVANPYTPPVDAQTQSFTLSTKTIVTKTPYLASLGARTLVNSLNIPNTLGNAAGNLSITVSTALTAGDVLEYTIYRQVFNQRQSLSDALRPTSDN